MAMNPLGWIDFSSSERERVRAALDALSTPGVLDELGIGPVRDALADRLFPGISTVQTRAKYFLLTAKLVEEAIERVRERRTSLSFAAYLSERERSCRIDLVRAYLARSNNSIGNDSRSRGVTGSGIIGGRFETDRSRDVSRKPSSIYWNGLRVFGFVAPTALSLAEFSRLAVDKKWNLRQRLATRSDDGGDDHDAEVTHDQPRIAPLDLPVDYWKPEKLTIELLPAEAALLREHIISRQPRSLLGKILDDEDALGAVAEFHRVNNRTDADELVSNFEAFCAMPAIARICAADEELSAVVLHARLFWRILRGAHIRYNFLVHSRLGTAEMAKELHAEWKKWRETCTGTNFPRQWDSQKLWSIVERQRISMRPHTRRFINGWIEQSRQGAGALSTCDNLVREQERQNKAGRARLRPTNSDRVTKWVGIKELDYRQPQACRILSDIYEGLAASGELS